MTEQEKSNPLEYRAPGDKSARQKGPESKGFLTGLLGGTAFSGVVWLSVYFLHGSHAGGEEFGSEALWAGMIGVPVVKIVAATAFLFVRGWRSCGAGVLLSLILGFLILLGLCGLGLN